MEIILGLVGLLANVSAFKKVTEEDITGNIAVLREIEWFQQYLQDDEYNKLIIHDEKVRKVIGKFNTNKLKKDPNHYTYQKKMHNIILKKSAA